MIAAAPSPGGGWTTAWDDDLDAVVYRCDATQLTTTSLVEVAKVRRGHYTQPLCSHPTVSRCIRIQLCTCEGGQADSALLAAPAPRRAVRVR